jgi:hypothetical protein
MVARIRTRSFGSWREERVKGGLKSVLSRGNKNFQGGGEIVASTGGQGPNCGRRCPVAGKASQCQGFLGHWLFGLSRLGRWVALRRWLSGPGGRKRVVLRRPDVGCGVAGRIWPPGGQTAPLILRQDQPRQGGRRRRRPRPTVLAPWGSGVAWAGNNRSWARERRGSRPVPVRTGRMRSARGRGVRHERAEDLHTEGAGRRAVLSRAGGWRRGAAGAEPARGVHLRVTCARAC